MLDSTSAVPSGQQSRELGGNPVAVRPVFRCWRWTDVITDTEEGEAQEAEANAVRMTVPVRAPSFPQRLFTAKRSFSNVD